MLYYIMPKFRPTVSPAFLANYKLALAKLQKQKQQSPAIPIPPAIELQAPSLPSEPAEDTQPPEHPLAHRWAILNIKLAPGRARYHVPLRGNFLLVVRECGRPMQSARHICEFYRLPSPDHKLTVEDALEDNKPFASILSAPFLFHSKSEAHQAIATAVADIAETNP